MKFYLNANSAVSSIHLDEVPQGEAAAMTVGACELSFPHEAPTDGDPRSGSWTLDPCIPPARTRLQVRAQVAPESRAPAKVGDQA